MRVQSRNKIVQKYEQEKAHQFLMILNEHTYSSIWTQILTLDPLPLLDRISYMVIQEQNDKSLMLGRDHYKKTSFRHHVKSITISLKAVASDVRQRDVKCCL